MKPGAFLLNMGRGGIIVESDLGKAIEKGIIAGAGIDVLEKEPIQKENPLLKLKNNDNLIITPHVAWAGVESRNLLIEKIYHNIQEFVKQSEK